MRLITSLAFVLLLTCSLAGQNWQPINTTETFHYKRDTAGYIEQSVRVDSVTFSGADTVWHLTRIVNSALDIHQPTCLQKRMSHDSLGNFSLSDTGSFLLQTRSVPGSSWSWTPGSTALLDTILYYPVLGELDSVKVILLSTGDTVLLSQQHGLLQMPLAGSAPYRLVGIEGRNLGILLPGFDGFYDFDAGEVFQYHSRWWNGDVVAWSSGERIWKMTVDSAFKLGDTLKIHYHSVGKSGTKSAYWDPMVLYPFADSGQVALVVDSLGHMTHALPAELLPAEFRVAPFGTDPHFTAAAMSFFSGNTRCYYAPQYLLMPDGRVNMQSMPPPIEKPLELFLDGSPTYSFADIEEIEFTVGLGMTHYRYSFFEPGAVWDLEGAYADGDTIGTLTPDDILLANDQAVESLPMAIYPQPAGDALHLHVEAPATGALQALDGREVLCFTLAAGQNALDIASLPSGLYLLRVEDGQRSIQRKVVVQR